MKNLARFLFLAVLVSAFGIVVTAQVDDDDDVKVFEVRLPVTVEKKKTKKNCRQ